MKNPSFFALVTLTSLSLLHLYAETPPEEPAVYAPKPMRLLTRHIEGNGIGYNRGYTTIEGFFAPYQKGAWLPFLDLRGHVLNNGQLAANTGLGLRYLSTSRAWGINSYYDYRCTDHYHYNQVALGLESLGAMWDFRINGYLPVGGKASSFWGASFDRFQGNQMLISRKREFVLKGANAEIGAHIDHFEKFPLYFTAGPYYLEGKGKNAYGGQVRASVDLAENFRIEGNTSYDNVFKWIGQGQVSLIIPFGHKKKVQPTKKRSSSENCTLQKRALQKVDRSEIIPVDTEHKSFVAINQETGTPWHFIFTDNTSHSLGTYASPYPTLLEAQNKAGANDALYAFPGSGAAYDTASSGHSGLQLKNNQRFLGSGTGHTVDSQYGPISILALSSAMPILTNSLAQSSVITLADQSVVTGFHFQGNEIKHAIFGNNNKGTVIERNVIAVSSSTPGDAAVHIESSDNTTENVIRFNSFTNSNKNSIKVKGRGTYSNNIFQNIDTPYDYTAIEIEGGQTRVHRNIFQGITTRGDFVGCTISTTEDNSPIVMSDTTFNSVTASNNFYGFLFSSTGDNSAITSNANTLNKCNAGNNFYGFLFSSTGANSTISSGEPSSGGNAEFITACSAGTDFYGWTLSAQGGKSPILANKNTISDCSARTGDFYGYYSLSSQYQSVQSVFSKLTNCTATKGNFYGWNTIHGGLDVQVGNHILNECTALEGDFYVCSELSSVEKVDSSINSITSCTAGTNFYGWHNLASSGDASKVSLKTNTITFCTAGTGDFYGWKNLYASTVSLETNTITSCTASTGDFYGWNATANGLIYFASNKVSDCTSQGVFNGLTADITTSTNSESCNCSTITQNNFSITLIDSDVDSYFMEITYHDTFFEPTLALTSNTSSPSLPINVTAQPDNPIYLFDIANTPTPTLTGPITSINMQCSCD